jgi:hypothetical protein
MLTGSVHNQRMAMTDGAVDLLVPLALPGVALLDFERTRAVAAIGYDASIETVSAWASTVPWLVRA